MTLRWDPDDVVEIYASLLRPGEEYKTIDLPTSPPWSEGVMSLGTIDLDEAEIGNEVVVQCGDHGTRIKNVRATVERYPYLSENRNSDVDTRTLRPVATR